MPLPRLLDPVIWARHLARAQAASPWRFVWGVLAVTTLMGVLAAGLTFDSSYEALLPRDSPEVKATDAVRERTGGFRQLVVALEGEDHEARLAYGHRLVERLRTVPGVRAADLELPLGFFEDRGLWLMEPAALDELTVAVQRAVQATTFPFGMLDPHTAWQRVEQVVQRERDKLPFKGSVLESEDGRWTFLLVTPSIKFSDMQAGKAFLADVDATVAALGPDAVGVSVRYAGNLALVQEQQQVMQRDMRNASVLALVFGIGVLWVFTRRPFAPLVVGGSLLCGVAWTFGLARLWVGHLNIITGFLVSVLIGLGIDFGVHLLIRYQQERAEAGSTPASAMARTVEETLPPALTGALTTAGTFLSFVFARFRGFSEFGLLAGAGVLLTLVSIFLLLPPLLVLLDTRLRLPPRAEAAPVRGNLSPRLAWPLVVGMVLLAGWGATQVGRVPFRNDYKLLRGTSPATEFLEYVDSQLGTGFNPAVFLVEGVQQARTLEELALAQRGAPLPDGQPSRVGRAFSAAHLVPRDVQAQRARIQRLADVVNHPSLDRYAAGEDARGERLRIARRMVAAAPWGLDDLPQAVRQRFLTPKGDALLVMLWPSEPNYADWQAAEWEDELNLLSGKLTAAGVPHQMADETLIIAWVYRIIQADGPRLLLLASLVVLGFLMVDFRSVKVTALVALPLAVGMLALVGVLGAFGLELNMFNLIVVPSLIGMGIDNAVHVWHRYRQEGPGSLRLVVRRTGIAALLCSLTTAVGFGSALIAHHLGLRSMGWLAILGLSTTFVSATLFFPALLSLGEGWYLRRLLRTRAD
ncbi:MAG: MMPL family transporter [Pseudomonadota bacterium]